jgi:DNA polymerase III subunit epsilon
MIDYFLARFYNYWLRFRLRGKRLSSLAKRNLEIFDYLDVQKKSKSCQFVVVDLETTGFNLQKDFVINIGAVKVLEGRIKLNEIFNELIKPDQNTPTMAIKIHWMVPDILAKARSFEEVFDSFLAYLGEDIIVGHHSRFDLYFLNRMMRKKYGFNLQNIVLDTEKLARNVLFPPHRYPYGIDINDYDHSLDNIANLFGIRIHERHTGLGDSFATAMIFQRMLSRLEKKGKERLWDLMQLGSVKTV